MEWFGGSVEEALNNYQQKQGILIVYVYADGDQNSAKFDELWKSFDTSRLTNIPYVAIRLLKNSEGAQQFAQFFPTLTIPVCYILGFNAQPLEVVTTLQALDMAYLNSSFAKAISLYKEQLKEQGISPKEEEPTQEKEEVVIADQNIQNTQGVPQTIETESEEVKGMSKEEKLEHYRKLLEQKKKTDAEKEKEEQQQKEVQRRNEGKAMAEAREKHRDRELREAAEARRKEKDEDAQALKRIRDQLKADKEERAKRNRGETGPAKEEVSKQESAPSSQPKINNPVNKDECRIQCKFPDGSSLQMTLPSKEPLSVVWDAVNKDARKPSSFFLVQPYPRRKLEEMDKSLLDYGLTPSSAILVIAVEKGNQQRGLVSPGYVTMLLGFIYFPFSMIYHYFMSLSTSFGIGGRNPTQNNATGQQQKKDNKKKESNEGNARDGNIRRFQRDDSDHSDNEATWNGNSTQQL